MKKRIKTIAIFFIAALISYYLINNFIWNEIREIKKLNSTTDVSIERIVEDQEKNIEIIEWDIYKTIYLAWGCFWCIEWVFDTKPGIISAVSWYAWGKTSTANYNNVVSGQTAHRETVKVVYNPSVLNLEDVLDTFFGYIDPYDTGWQFADRGYQYTTAIFYTNLEEKNEILDYINNHDFEENLATKFIEISSFYQAEEYHQDYALKQSGHYARYFQWSGRKDYVDENKDKYK